MSESLASTIHEGFLAVAGRPESQVDPVELRARARDRSLSPAERDDVFAVAVYNYRAGPREVWGPVVLELLAPAITRRVSLLVPPEGGIKDSEDLSHQYLLEVLRAVAKLPMRRSSNYLRLRVLRRADKGIGRWLEKEAFYQGRRNELAEELTAAEIEPWR